MICTIDASVFVAAARETEEHYTISRKFLQQMRAQAVNVVCPTLVLPECAAAIARPTRDPTLAEEIVTLVESFTGLQLIALDHPLAHQAAQIATHYHLRGADSVYAAVSETFNATLVTWDTEMLQRACQVVPTVTPADWLEKQTVNA